eukprot:Phypoly_transcript_08805.p1 GENE.Phypoly_transcript_08805~~Phypoly_transcript_08805.p1  ORF type:complete len:447 (+),score=45.76 Phypoly_transcript_08805:78-1418(+)
MSDHEGSSSASEDLDLSRFFDRFPKRRRNDVVEMALEEFRDAWHKEIIIKTSFIGGVDKPILEKIFSFLDLPAAVSAMWTCSTWRDVVYGSSMSMWLYWCANTSWKFDFPVPTMCSDLKKYGIVRYKSERRWLKGAVRPPTFSEVYTLPTSPPTTDAPLPNNNICKMHFHEDTLAFYDTSYLHVLDLNNKTDHKTLPIAENDRLSSISVNRGNIAASMYAGVVNIYKNATEALECVHTLAEKAPGNVHVHLEDNKLTFASNSCVRVYDLNSKTSYALPTRPFRITSIDVCGNLLVQANAETRQIEVWDTQQQKLIKSISGGGMTKGLRIDSNCISGIEGTTPFGFYNSVLKVWDLRTQTQRTIHPSLTSDTFRNHFMHEGKLVISCASDLVQVWHGSFTSNYPHCPMYEISVPWESPVHQIDKIQCDWEKIVIGCESGALYMWNFT